MTTIEQHVKWAENIARAVARTLPPSFDVADLIQEALIETWRALADYDPSRNDNFQGYAYQRVRGACLMSVRRRHWRAATMEEIPADAETALRPDAIVEARLPLLGLESRIAQLTPRLRRVIELHYVRDVPMSEIARRMRISVTTAHSLRSEALDALRAIIGREKQAA